MSHYPIISQTYIEMCQFIWKKEENSQRFFPVMSKDSARTFTSICIG